MEHCQAFTITDDASTFLAQNISAIVSRDTMRSILSVFVVIFTNLLV